MESKSPTDEPMPGKAHSGQSIRDCYSAAEKTEAREHVSTWLKPKALRLLEEVDSEVPRGVTALM